MKHTKIQNQLLGVVLIVILFFGCAPVYIPNHVNAPLLSNEGELQGSLNLGISGFDPQIAYAFSDKFAFMANVSMNFNGDSVGDDKHKHFFAEGGLGYYSRFANAGRLEIFVGYGMGEIESEATVLGFDRYAKAKYNRFFIQSDIGMTTEIVDLAFAPRLAFVQMDFQNLPIKKTLTPFLEPTFILRIGYRYVYFSTQWGLSFPIGGVAEDRYDYQPFIGSFGIHFKINKFYPKIPSY